MFGFLKNLLKTDLDELFSYNTIAVIRVKDKRLGLLHYFLVIAIVCYVVIYQLILQKNFLLKEAPAGGNVKVNILPRYSTELSSTEPDYCNSEHMCKFGALYHSLEENSALITTRLTVTKVDKFLENCNEPINLASDLDCLLTPDKIKSKPKTTYYIAGVEDMSIVIEHQVRGQKTNIHKSYNQINGKLAIRNNKQKNIKTIKRFPKDKEAPKDYAFTLRELLQAADINLDEKTTHSDNSIRYNGIVIIVFIEYRNNIRTYDEVNYVITAKAISETDFKYEHLEFNDMFPEGQPDSNIATFMNEHGIRIVVKQTGELGKFDFVTLLSNLVAGIALVSISSFIVDIIMIKILPEKRKYTEYKIKETDHFSSIRKKMKGLNSDTQI